MRKAAVATWVAYAVLGVGAACVAQIPSDPTASAAAAGPGKIVVQVDQPGAKISPTLYGLMTEEINFSYEGGLYGELIQNRTFKSSWRGAAPTPSGGDAIPPTATVPTEGVPCWSVVHSDGARGTISLDTSDPINTVALTTSLKLDVTSVDAGGRVGVANEGYWGIPVRPDTTYQASFYAKASGGFSGPLSVGIESNDGKTSFASATVPAITDTWQKYSVTLKTGQVEPTAAARFVISGASTGTVNLNLVSLFPPTYKDRPNGNRVDLMQLLADMSPAFLRFPGGNYLEGADLANRWDWKATIGPLEQRPGHMSPWRYHSTDGMGLLEFMGWCEDLGMEPVLGVFAGYVLRGYDADFTGDALQPYIDEALDEIEYLTGDVSTTWGARRAKDGHPEPFKLRYVEIGNEDPDRGTYSQRFPAFYRAIKAKYPAIQVISSVRNGYGDVVPDVIDEHYYMGFSRALTGARMYDNRPRTTADGTPVPRVFVGEWATRDNNPTPAFRAALTDAAFLTGLERNADLVIMSCYAPLLVNVSDLDGPTRSMQWATNLIGYNALSAYGSPSYYAQRMFYNARGDRVLPVADVTPQTLPPESSGRGTAPPLYASASKDDASGDVILKVVNPFATDQTLSVELAGADVLKNATGQVMAGEWDDTNTLDDPLHVVPKDFAIDDASATWEHTFPGNSITVIRFKTR